jgi:hypothetical protein
MSQLLAGVGEGQMCARRLLPRGCELPVNVMASVEGLHLHWALNSGGTCENGSPSLPKFQTQRVPIGSARQLPGGAPGARRSCGSDRGPGLR